MGDVIFLPSFFSEAFSSLFDKFFWLLFVSKKFDFVALETFTEVSLSEYSNSVKLNSFK